MLQQKLQKRFQYNEKIHFILAERPSRNNLGEKESHQKKNSCCEILKCIFVFLLRFKREIYCHSTINMILYIESQNMYSKLFIFYRDFFCKENTAAIFPWAICSRAAFIFIYIRSQNCRILALYKFSCICYAHITIKRKM